VAADEPAVVVDTNIIFSALLSADSRFREVMFTSARRFVICETTIIELFRLKDKLLALRPNTSEEVLLSMLHAILRRVEHLRETPSTRRPGTRPPSFAAPSTWTTRHRSP